ncbi:hypothetical protein BLNAU_6010 [Blattamonas nauphoetae]|uniref:Mucin-2-like n=1 Tax=Blattamonas nauphoetae TaxID=2049346 RepID=A0ABQ9Y5J9_9EUKA|nr:hypothetical protein BLNAU_6010 [Blattamonas nauphoetae]
MWGDSVHTTRSEHPENDDPTRPITGNTRPTTTTSPTQSHPDKQRTIRRFPSTTGTPNESRFRTTPLTDVSSNQLPLKSIFVCPTPSLHTTTPPLFLSPLPNHETQPSTNKFPNNPTSLLSTTLPLPTTTTNTPPFFNDPLLPSTVPLEENTQFTINVFSCHVHTSTTPIPSPTSPLSTRSTDTNTQSLIENDDPFDFDENTTSGAFRVPTPINLLDFISNDTSFESDEQFTRTTPDDISTPSITISETDSDPPNQLTRSILTPSPFHPLTIRTEPIEHSPNPHNTLPTPFSPISQPLGTINTTPTITTLPPDTLTTPHSTPDITSPADTFNSFSPSNNPPISTFFSPTTTLPPNPTLPSIFTTTLSIPSDSPALHPTNTDSHAFPIVPHSDTSELPPSLTITSITVRSFVVNESCSILPNRYSF